MTAAQEADGRCSSDGCPHDLTPPATSPASACPWCPLHGLVEQLQCPSADQMQKCRTSGCFEPMGEALSQGGWRPLELGVQSYVVVCVKDTSSVTYITCRPWEARGVTMTAGGGDGAKRGNRTSAGRRGGGRWRRVQAGGEGPRVRPAVWEGVKSGQPTLTQVPLEFTRVQLGPEAFWLAPPWAIRQLVVMSYCWTGRGGHRRTRPWTQLQGPQTPSPGGP